MVVQAGEIAIVASMVVGGIVAGTRRVPLAAALALPAAVVLFRFCASCSLRWLAEELAVLAGTLFLSIPIGFLVVWAAIRCFYWIPDRLSPSVPEEDGAEALKSLAELGRLGFRSRGSLCLPEGLERQMRWYFMDPTGTIAARVMRNWWGLCTISFCSEQDGVRLVTSDCAFIPAFPLPPGRVVWLHQACRTPAELLRFHRIHLAELAMDAPDRCRHLLQREQLRYEEGAEDAVQRRVLVRRAGGRLTVAFRAMPGLVFRGLFLDYRRKSRKFGR